MANFVKAGDTWIKLDKVLYVTREGGWVVVHFEGGESRYFAEEKVEDFLNAISPPEPDPVDPCWPRHGQ